MARLDVTHPPDFGQTASAARDLMPHMVDGAMPIPAATKLAHGQMSLFRVTSEHSEPSATFRGPAQAVPHHSHRTSTTRVDSQIAGPSRDTNNDSELQQPSPK